MDSIAQKFNTTLSKVTNWFKQKRRRDYFKGKLIKKVKKNFKLNLIRIIKKIGFQMNNLHFYHKFFS